MPLVHMAAAGAHARKSLNARRSLRHYHEQSDSMEQLVHAPGQYSHPALAAAGRTNRPSTFSGVMHAEQEKFKLYQMYEQQVKLGLVKPDDHHGDKSLPLDGLGSTDPIRVREEIEKTQTELNKINPFSRAATNIVGEMRREILGHNHADHEEIPRSSLPMMLRICTSKEFNFTIYTVILINSIQMGIQVDFNGPAYDPYFEVMDTVCTVVFVTEMVCKLAAYKLYYFWERWNIFDFVIVWTSILDQWIFGKLLRLEHSNGWFLSILRILRIFRVVRTIRLMRAFKELVLIMKGMTDSLATIMWVAVLLLMMLFIAGIFFAQQIGTQDAPYEGYDEEPVWEFNNYLYFGTLGRSMFTLFNLALLTEDWDNVGRAVLEKQPWLLIFLLLFLCFNTFGLMNVIVGVIVDNTLAAAEAVNNDHAKIEMEERLAQLDHVHDFVIEMNGNEEEKITIKQLTELWERPEMVTILRLIQLPVGSSPEELMALLDADGDGCLDAEEFVRNTVRMLSSDSHQHFLTALVSLHQILLLVRELSAVANAIREQQVGEEQARNESYRHGPSYHDLLYTNHAPSDWVPPEERKRAGDPNRTALHAAKQRKSETSNAKSPRVGSQGDSFKRRSSGASLSTNSSSANPEEHSAEFKELKADLQKGFKLMWEEVRRVGEKVKQLQKQKGHHSHGSPREGQHVELLVDEEKEGGEAGADDNDDGGLSPTTSPRSTSLGVSKKGASRKTKGLNKKSKSVLITDPTGAAQLRTMPAPPDAFVGTPGGGVEETLRKSQLFLQDFGTSLVNNFAGALGGSPLAQAGPTAGGPGRAVVAEEGQVINVVNRPQVEHEVIEAAEVMMVIPQQQLPPAHQE